LSDNKAGNPDGFLPLNFIRKPCDAGYQGWLTAQSNGADRCWYYFEKPGKSEPGINSIDI
jgi:hypothetical protein